MSYSTSDFQDANTFVIEIVLTYLCYYQRFEDEEDSHNKIFSKIQKTTLLLGNTEK